MEAAIDSIDLLTYNGEDPRLSEEPICQVCLTKQSERTLVRSPRSPVVWVCSADCSTQGDDLLDHLKCLMTIQCILRLKRYMEFFQQKLLEEHNVDLDHPNGQGRAVSDREVRKANKTMFRDLDITILPADTPLPDERMSVSRTLANYSNAVFILADGLDKIAVLAHTKKLHEDVLDLCVINLKLVRHDSSPRFLSNLTVTATSTLIHLNRLDDAFCFIRDYMASTGKSKAFQSLHELHGEPGSRYNDCLDWMKSSLVQAYPSRSSDKYDKESQEYSAMLVCLLIIKLRVRIPAARQAWESTLKDTFFKTDMGKMLEPVFPILKEMFLLGVDDHEQLEQIRGLMAMIHVLDPTKLPRIIDAVQYDETLPLGNFGGIPGALELVSTEFLSAEFVERCSNETLVDDIAKNHRPSFGKKILSLLSCLK